MVKTFHIPSLDGIRAAAFLIVFIAHNGAKSIVPGGFGVTVFFFLSGYLISTLLRNEYESTRSINLGNFYVRRLFRILPLQYSVFAVAILFCLNGILPGQPTLTSILLQVLQLTNYLTMHGTEMVPFGTGIYWSLSVEEHFYLVFPLVLRWLLKKYQYDTVALIFFNFCLFTLFWRLYLVTSYGDFEERIYRGTDTRIDSILFGCILSLWNNPVSDKPVLTPSIWFLFSALSIVVLTGTFMMKDLILRESIRYTLQGIALYPLFYAAIKFSGWWIFRPLQWKWVKHIGVLSYALYLVHYVVIYLTNQISPINDEVINGTIALIVSLVIAQALHICIEMPCIQWRKKFLTNLS